VDSGSVPVPVGRQVKVAPLAVNSVVGERVQVEAEPKRSGDAQSEGAGTLRKATCAARQSRLVCVLRVVRHECNDERDDLLVVLRTEPVGR